MSDAIQDRHQHPVSILRYTYKYLFLLLVPLVRGLRYIRTPEGLYAWARGTWIDLVAVLVLLTLPYFAWRRHTYTVDEDGFHIRQGIMLRRTSFVPRRSVTTLTVERPFFLRPLRAVRIAVDTDAGGDRRADFSLTVGERAAREILEQRIPVGDRPLHRYQPRWYLPMVLSLLMSNSFSGILLLATTFQQTGRLLGEEFQRRVIGELETAAGYMTVIPRTAAIIALVLLVSWCVAAIGNMLYLLPFRATRYPGTLSIRSGLFTRRDHSCTAASVNYVDYRQTLPSKLFRLHLVFINCVGYGKGKNSMAVLVPAAPVRSSERQVRRLLPEFHRHSIDLRVAPLSVYRYIFYPLWGMILLYPAAQLVRGWFPVWQDLIHYLTYMAYIPLLWQTAVKLIDRYTAGLSRADGFYTLRYSRMFTFHTVIVPEEKVTAAVFRQSVFQRWVHNCDVLVYTYNESRRPHCIRNLPLAAAQALFADAPAA